MKKGVSIVIPTWNGCPLLQRFFPSVLAAKHYYEKSGLPVELIIVDDGSTDDTVQWLSGQGFEDTGLIDSEPATNSNSSLRTTGGDLRLIRTKLNRGFSEACNRGFVAARQDLVFLLNNDVEVDIDVIGRLAQNFRDRSIFAVHCRVFDLESGKECGTAKVGSFSRGFIRVHQSYTPTARPSGTQPYYSMFAGGGSAMFDRHKLLEIGGFEALLSPFYWEDVELSYRAWKRGYTVLYEPAAIVRHQLSSTIGKLKRRRVRRIEQRNRLIYHWIHLHDGPLMAGHVFWLIILILTAPVRMRLGFILSVFDALRVLPAVRRRRIEEAASSVRGDREIFALFGALSQRPDLTVYDDVEQMKEATDSARWS